MVTLLPYPPLLKMTLLVWWCAALVQAVVTEQCQRETKEIQSYSSLQEGLQLSLHHIQGHAYDCNYTTMTEFVCMIEYEGNEEKLAPYRDFCNRATGKMIGRDIELHHMLLGMLSFNVTVTGIPQCVGLSCNPATIEQEDLPNNVFDKFKEEMEVGDLCDEETDPWGTLDFWSNFGVQVASWSGIDLRDCFSDPEEEDDEGGDGVP